MAPPTQPRTLGEHLELVDDDLECPSAPSLHQCNTETSPAQVATRPETFSTESPTLPLDDRATLSASDDPLSTEFSSPTEETVSSPPPAPDPAPRYPQRTRSAPVWLYPTVTH